MVSTRCLVFCAGSLLVGGAALAEPDPSTAQVLGKLHRSNLEEVRMGKLAEERGHSRDIKTFGRTLVKDHDAADAKVSKLAKQEGVDLAANTPAEEQDDMPTGAGFDAAFAKGMLDVHEKDIADVKAARDSTTDKKLKSLLGDLLPVLERHEAAAQKLVDQFNRS
jgi:putative membrane protein